MFVPLVHAPGEAQADFGEALVVVAEVERRRSSRALNRTGIYRRRRDPGMILDMVRHGSKLGRVNLVDLQIADGSGAAFRREYIYLTVIAEAEQMSTVELMRRCAEHNVRILLLPITRQGLQPIIRATDQGRLTVCQTEGEATAHTQTK
jgi:hypothetical protein